MNNVKYVDKKGGVTVRKVTQSKRAIETVKHGFYPHFSLARMNKKMLAAGFVRGGTRHG